MTRDPVKVVIQATALAVLLAAFPAGAAALSGSVVDENQRPVVGAEVCYLLGEAEGICVETNKKGVYDLPLGPMSTIRIKASGFQSTVVKVGSLKGPVVLARAAALWVRVRDVATGRTVPESQVFLVFPGGHREGPLPANDKGVKIRTLVPGSYGVLARAEGYTQIKAVSVELDPGSDEWIDVEMKPDGKKR